MQIPAASGSSATNSQSEASPQTGYFSTTQVLKVEARVVWGRTVGTREQDLFVAFGGGRLSFLDFFGEGWRIEVRFELGSIWDFPRIRGPSLYPHIIWLLL